MPDPFVDATNNPLEAMPTDLPVFLSGMSFTPSVVPASPSGVRRILSTPSTLNDAINAALFASGLTQSELARRLGIRAQSIDQYRRGVRANPSVEWLIRYLQVCGGRLIVELPHAAL